MRKAILWFWILVLGMLGREVPARDLLILEHETTSLASERQALRNEHLYEQTVEVRSDDPTRFDRLHPILGDLLTDRSSFEYWLNRWQDHPARFEHWHPLFWRIIDGEALHGGPPVIPSHVSPAGPGGDHPVAADPPSPSGLVGLVGLTAVVPEPDSFRLVLETLGLILVARGGIRFLRRG